MKKIIIYLILFSATALCVIRFACDLASHSKTNSADYVTRSYTMKKSAANIIKEDTTITYILKNMNTGIVKEYRSKPGVSLLGCTEWEFKKYLMKHSLNDDLRSDSITGIDIDEFSKEAVTVNISYEPEIFYLKAEGGKVVIYRDNNKLYDYTDIRVSLLPKALQAELINTIRLESEKELYDFLESCSS